MRKFLLTSLVAGAVVVAGCAGRAQTKEFEELVQRAENEIKVAQKTGFLWRDTEKHLKEAKETQKEDHNRAMKLAKKALDEALMAQQQAKANANAKPDFTYKKP